jgi:hypothetical protein
LIATVVAAATILVLSSGAVAAADPDSSTSARANGASAGATVTLGARSHSAGTTRLRLDHGGGLKPPATDIEIAPVAVGGPASGVGLALASWVLVFVASVLASLRFMARRSRL